MENIKIVNDNKKDYMHKKLAAIELHKAHRKIFVTSTLGIIACTVPLIFNTISAWAGSISAMIFSGFLAYVGFQSLQTLTYLKKKYELN